MFRPFTLNCRGRLVAVNEPAVMGIINCTPDSFYAGSRQQAEDAVLAQAAKMLSEGALILDLGGQSTRPGAALIGAEQEAERVMPAIESIIRQFPQAILSIDTFHASVAGQAMGAGCAVVNDVSGGFADPEMLSVAAKTKAVYVCMHSRGNAQTMSQLQDYEDIVADLLAYFTEREKNFRDAGINDWLIDPGFGFAKNAPQNLELLGRLASLSILDRPLLVGLSRKSTVYKTLGVTAAEALNGTTVLHTLALQQGAAILRVHDVKPAREAIQMMAAFGQAQASAK